MKDADDVFKQLKKTNPLAIILFGSGASGKMRPDSDLDILVIKDSKESFLDRISEIRRQIKTHTPLDLIVLTPQEAKEMPAKSSFFKQIFEEGKLIYGRI